MIVLFNQELINEIDKLRQQPQKVAQTTNTFTITAGDPPGSIGRGGTDGACGINIISDSANFINDRICGTSTSEDVDVAITLPHSKIVAHIPFKHLKTVRDFTSAEADKIHGYTYKDSMLSYISGFKQNRDSFLSYQSMFPIIRFLRTRDYASNTIHPFIKYWDLSLKGWFFPGTTILIALTSIDEFKRAVTKLLDSDISPVEITTFIDRIRSSLYYVIDEEGNELALILRE